MCRLFGMHAGHHPAKASFWLLRAANSLEHQSRYGPDGTGIGSFAPDGTPCISKQPISARHDPEFAFEAKHLESTTFLAHVRYASTGGHTPKNTHPFMQDGRLLAHNGVLGALGELDRRLALLGTSHLVLGQTDSERMFALVTAEIRRNKGDVATGIAAALTWISEHLPVYSLNFILTTATDLWAVRYPRTHELYVLERRIETNLPHETLVMHSARIHAHSPALAARSSVIVATERMNADPAWRLMEPGELLHVNEDLGVESTFPLPENPLQLMTLKQLDPQTAASQHPYSPAGTS
ncbi:class II glutamine amidotransferase [Paeniglutamicibacter sp. NPDC091659]|uniref:class II glutamine amidotransferase n=1 Tax=Paeniglutamicibacter sp. NPDC091659 TaxID=3364389 RepID=UPI00381AEA30